MENKTYKAEYSQVTSNPKPCYSNLENYGVGGNFQKTIINPRPATITPQLYWRLLQHNVPTYLVRNQPYHPPQDFNSIPYGKINRIE